MDEEKTPREWIPKKTLTKGQAITAMAVGGLMLLLSIVIPTEKESTAYIIKVIAGLLGLCVIIVGSLFRPPKNTRK